MQDRFDLICDVLEDNGVKDDELYDYDFWNKKVEPSEIIRLLNKIAYEGIEEIKKKQKELKI